MRNIKTKSKVKRVKLSRIEKAIMMLAYRIQNVGGGRIEAEALEILGYELPTPSKKK